jgi:hypothetical protein
MHTLHQNTTRWQTRAHEYVVRCNPCLFRDHFCKVVDSAVPVKTPDPQTSNRLDRAARPWGGVEAEG